MAALPAQLAAALPLGDAGAVLEDRRQAAAPLRRQRRHLRFIEGPGAVATLLPFTRKVVGARGSIKRWVEWGAITGSRLAAWPPRDAVLALQLPPALLRLTAALAQCAPHRRAAGCAHPATGGRGRGSTWSQSCHTLLGTCKGRRMVRRVGRLGWGSHPHDWSACVLAHAGTCDVPTASSARSQRPSQVPHPPHVRTWTPHPHTHLGQRRQMKGTAAHPVHATPSPSSSQKCWLALRPARPP